MINVKAFFLIGMLFLLGCEETTPIDENVKEFCQVTNPIQDLDWLKQRVENLKNRRTKVKISKAVYDKIEGFIISDCYECPDAPSYFYDCQGNVLCELGGYDGKNSCPDFNEKLKDRELIWENN